MSTSKFGIQSTLDDVAAAVKAGKRPEEIRRLLYASDMVVVGEGMPNAVRGDKEFMPVLTEILESWGPAPTLRFTIVDPVIGREEFVTTMVDLEILRADPGIPAELLRIMYVWVNGCSGWRVAAEMFTVGSY